MIVMQVVSWAIILWPLIFAPDGSVQPLVRATGSEDVHVSLRSRRDDLYLCWSVFLAARRAVPPDQVEVITGFKATMNTIRAADKEVLEGVSIDPEDLLSGEVLVLRPENICAYWVRPTGKGSPRVIGIIWTPDRRAHCFFGVIARPT